MTVPVVLSVVAGACLLMAALAWLRARRLAARLDELAHACWQLRYEVEELRLQLQARADPAPKAPPPPRPPAGEAFVPLASLKR